MSDKELLTVKDVVRDFGFKSESAVRCLIDRKEIPHRRLGRRVYMLRHELETFFSTLPGPDAAEAATHIKHRAVGY